MKDGDQDAFVRSWKKRSETFYNHWTRGEPNNQIQLAFRRHWAVFSELMEDPRYRGGRRCLEVGCGRGTISAYFSDAGFDCTLLDISEDVIERARQIFAADKLDARFRVGDANRLPFEDGSYDTVVSIGLLEHFTEIATPISEQIRVLASGGLLLCYVVPHYEDNVQTPYRWINSVLEGYAEATSKPQAPKDEIYRSDAGSPKYVPLLKQGGLEGVSARGIYPLPMISHSIQFPFTLMPERSERAVVAHFGRLLRTRADETGENPWWCDEGFGQAFLVWGYKP